MYQGRPARNASPARHADASHAGWRSEAGGRRKPNRLNNYDYSQSGWYFVTICVQNRECLFGQVENGRMIVNNYGRVAQQYWSEIPEHYEGVILDEFIVMPNHVHGIIVIANVGDRHACPLQSDRPHQTLPIIIGSFKSATTKQINQIRQTPSNPVWQRSFHDHIIRNEKSYWAIREYIRNNPANWTSDEENPSNIN